MPYAPARSGRRRRISGAELTIFCDYRVVAGATAAFHRDLADDLENPRVVSTRIEGR
jgi:hypothetical protein